MSLRVMLFRVHPHSRSGTRRIRWPLVFGLVLVQVAVFSFGSLLAAGQINPYGRFPPQPGPPPPVLGDRTAQLRADIRYLAHELPRVYGGGHVLTGERREKFQAAAADLSQQVPLLTPAQLYVGFMRLLATLHDGETGITLPPVAQAPLLPIDVRWYGDDLRLVAAPPGRRDLLGARILAVGSTPIGKVRQLMDEVLAAVTSWERASLYHFYMQSGVILEGLGLVRDPLAVPLTVQDLRGRTLHVTVTATNVNSERAPGMIYPPKTLASENPQLPYWWRYLPESNIAYIKYNQCLNDKGFQRAAKDAIAAAKAHPHARLVVDFRGNGGGSSRPFDALIKAIRGTALDRRGGIYAVTDRLTFSSATLDAVHLRTRTHALLIGEPTGDPVNQFGDQKYLQLTNYLPVHYSTKHFDPAPMYHGKPYVAPDVPVPTSLRDLLNGTDPVLAAIASAR